MDSGPAPSARPGMTAAREQEGERDMSGPRFKPLSTDEMTPEQTRVVQALTEGPRGGLRGPFPELLYDRDVSDKTFAAAVERFGEKTVLDLVSLASYYGFVSLILNVNRTPIPDGATPLPPLAGKPAR